MKLSVHGLFLVPLVFGWFREKKKERITGKEEKEGRVHLGGRLSTIRSSCRCGRVRLRRDERHTPPTVRQWECRGLRLVGV